MTMRPPKILIIAENIADRKAASVLLARNGYEVATTASGSEGKKFVESFKPDVVLLDVTIAGQNEYEVCSALQASNPSQNIPVIIAVEKSDTAAAIKGLKNGAADYLAKPFEPIVLLTRVAIQVKIKKLWDEIQKKDCLLAELAQKDEVTGLYNHRFFQERLAEEFMRAERFNLPLTCIFITIDHFKQICESLGQKAGDQVLKSFAKILLTSIRAVDVAARCGGEEFALILPHTDKENAKTLCERLTKRIESKTFHVNGENIAVTVSLGLAGIPDFHITNKNDLIKLADAALFADKENSITCLEPWKQL